MARHSLGKILALVVVANVAGIAAVHVLPGQPSEKPGPEAAPPEPVPEPTAVIVELRDRLYGDLSLDDACALLGKDATAVLGRLTSRERWADVRDVLEAPDFHTMHRNDGAYWAALARVRHLLGDPVGAADSVRTLIEKATGARMRYAAHRLAHELEVELPAGNSRVLGVVCELGYQDGMALVAGFADGQARLFFGNGGGILGNFKDEPAVAAAARDLVRAGRLVARRFPVQRDRRLPLRGRARFVFLTTGGPRIANAEMLDLENGRGPTSRVFEAMHELITQLRKLRG